MFCTHCGKIIAADSFFCPYCGRCIKYEQLIFCTFCREQIKEDSKFCPYCGASLANEVKRQTAYSLPRIAFRGIIKNRFLLLYIIWLVVNSILFYNAQNAYSNYFNSSNVSPNHWLSNDNGIYPEDWLYPFKNIFSGIMGQDPIYVYDMSEFVLYTIIVPLFLFFCLSKRHKIFKNVKASESFFWTVWYLSLWMLVAFPLGLFGLDFLGWGFTMGGLIIGIYSYKKTFSHFLNKQ
jgi:RNA polymerase subunit RPABC4/transcription elongation factor Spt4